MRGFGLLIRGSGVRVPPGAPRRAHGFRRLFLPEELVPARPLARTIGPFRSPWPVGPGVDGSPPGGTDAMPLHPDYAVVMYPISVRFHDAAVADRLKAEASTHGRSTSALA